MAKRTVHNDDKLLRISMGREPKPIKMWAGSFRYIKHVRKQSGYTLRKQHHDGYELVCVDHGRLRVTIRNKSFQLSASDGIIIPPNAPHRFTGPARRSVQFLNIIFFGNCPATLLTQRITMGPDDRRVMRRMCDELIVEERWAKELAVVKLNELLIQLARRSKTLTKRTRVEGENRLNHRQRVVAAALAYLEANLDRPLDGDAVATHTRVSAAHLRDLVREETGKALGKHLIEMRMAEAQRLMHESPQSVKEVAHTVGYQSVGHFCNLFKAQLGMTPGEFARSLGAGHVDDMLRVPNGG